MCGICGVISSGRRVGETRVRRMAATMVPRGPDDDGHHFGPDVGFGCRRLSIIDLDTGNQPVSNEAGNVVAMLNGEIFNFRDLREELQRRGHVFRTRGDAEVLPHLYEEHGSDLFEHLRGMFAIAIWDAERRMLVLGRDRLGEKPLYYSTHAPDGAFVFASEAKALLAAGVPRDPDVGAIVQYLFHLYVPAPASGFSAIKKLLPGHVLELEGGEVRISQYWRPSFRPTEVDEGRSVAGVRERVIDAVRSRLIADVPLGAFLSGGLDSATVVAAMRAAGADPVHTFTITFEGFDNYDEAVDARATAEHFGTQHHELTATLAGPEGLPFVVDAFDEPFGNPTALLLSALSSVTREHVKVALSGDGADELFFGYPRFRGLAYAARYRRFGMGPLRRVALAAASAVSEGSDGPRNRRVREFLEVLGAEPRDAYMNWIGYFTPPMLDRLLVPDLRGEGRRTPMFLAGLFDTAGATDLNAVSEVELQSFLPYNVLEYADKMSMAHGLEVRAPFVDHHLVDYVSALPADMKLRGRTSKWALRKAFAPELPQHVVRGTKRGLNPPLGEWLSRSGRLLDDLLSKEAVAARGLFQWDAIRRLRGEHESGWRDRSLHLWALLVLEIWFRHRIDPAPRTA